ncbi:hypothetical protein CWI37_0253p0010 [Hamiltosporidium tvaerminnensis]|uniref:Uncharacterized protein n=1 Tax=Hamiltosporidium tvaerminnensis TaxID=1176355 RepID=A0A4Q9L8I1_9MICR|nr:hypothetical protein CWI37_0253p0010 [Hamiltosporidium tvaerminnensis]
MRINIHIGLFISIWSISFRFSRAEYVGQRVGPTNTANNTSAQNLQKPESKGNTPEQNPRIQAAFGRAVNAFQDAGRRSAERRNQNATSNPGKSNTNVNE